MRFLLSTLPICVFFEISLKHDMKDQTKNSKIISLRHEDESSCSILKLTWCRNNKGSCTLLPITLFNCMVVLFGIWHGPPISYLHEKVT